MAEAIEKYEDYINKLHYIACDGKLADIERLESLNLYDYLSFINLFIEKIETKNG